MRATAASRSTEYHECHRGAPIHHRTSPRSLNCALSTTCSPSLVLPSSHDACSTLGSAFDWHSFSLELFSISHMNAAIVSHCVLLSVVSFCLMHHSQASPDASDRITLDHLRVWPTPNVTPTLEHILFRYGCPPPPGTAGFDAQR